jgi:uncharacterized protein (DUF1330 family)
VSSARSIDHAEDTTMAIYPTPEQIQELLRGPADQPVVMVNLLRFKRRADAAPDDARSGEEAYMAYARRMREIVESHGGRFVWSGRVDSVVIGDGEAAFQVVGLVEYPSRQKFVEIATSDRVQEIGVDRAGLESQWLLAATAVPNP